MNEIVKSYNVEKSIFQFRPSAKLIHSIGSELIGSAAAAIFELVKNGYDADADYVNIVFEYYENDSLKIIIHDSGHGMSFDTITTKWLVPATDDKLVRKVSPVKERIMQGRKGLGRFAAAFLGQDLLIESWTGAEYSSFFIEWENFTSDKFLDEINILVERKESIESSGTRIEIVATEDKYNIWQQKTSIDKLMFELQRLISPPLPDALQDKKKLTKDKFNVTVFFNNNCPVSDYSGKTVKIKPSEILSLYDYRIFGVIDKNGSTELTYENGVEKIIQSEKIPLKLKLLPHGVDCGNIYIDLRVYDRDPESIDNLIAKGLVNSVGEVVGKSQAKKLLDAVYGVNIYRNTFRVSPYGSDGNDWLNLDKDRIQNFTLKVSNNQIVGFVMIKSEEDSNLIEKSARDGLKENDSYDSFVSLVKQALHELEFRRLIYRQKTKKGRKSTVMDDVRDLFSFSTMADNIGKKLKQLNVTDGAIKEVKQIIEQETVSKDKLFHEIEQKIAVYQGQATLGKITTVLLHEVRKPVQAFNLESGIIANYLKSYKQSPDQKYFNEIEVSVKNIKEQALLLSGLFKRFDPFSITKRGFKKAFNLKATLDKCFNIFSANFTEDSITCEISCSENITIYGWEIDLLICMSNLIENSIYWLADTANKKIIIEALEDEDGIFIDYYDNGAGIKDSYIDDSLIFEPGFSTKITGTGIGLALAGEAVGRLNGKLKAVKYLSGAHFQLEIKNAAN